jgi:hypothetical protein
LLRKVDATDVLGVSLRNIDLVSNLLTTSPNGDVTPRVSKHFGEGGTPTSRPNNSNLAVMILVLV